MPVDYTLPFAPMPAGLHTAQSLAAAGERTLEADVVVIGLGAGGGLAFADLACAGLNVLGVESGPYLGPEQMKAREEQMLPQLFADGASRTTDDFAIAIMQGKGVGGSTLHNTNLCKRLPQGVLEHWAEAFGLGEMTSASLQQDFADVERELNIGPVPDDRVNPNNQALARGAMALGYRHARLSYNRKGCQGAGMCELGCPNDAKQNVTRVYVPQGLARGGRVITQLHARRILHRNGRVEGLEAVAVCPHTQREQDVVTIRAPRVVLAASATGSPLIAQRSAVPDPHRLLGTNLHLHPGALVVGVFDHAHDAPMEGWLGVPQSVECTEFLEFGPGARQRAWLVSGFAHPGAAAGFVPGFGAAHLAWMRQYPRMACVIVMLHDHATGRVSPGRGRRPLIHYRLDAEEYAQLALGLREAGKILLAAGAQKVLIPTSPVLQASRAAELDRLGPRDLGPLNPALTAVHPMSTMWMGEDPRRAVVDARGEHHQLKGLYVADGSLFPTSIGGPPQVPIFALARQVARHLRQSI